MKNKLCECGCGSLIENNKRFVWGHNFKNRKLSGGHIECINCKNEFYVPNCRSNAKFCSLRCYGESIKGKHFSPKTEFKKGLIPWQTGLTKETDLRLKKIGENLTNNKLRSIKISNSHKGVKLSECHKKRLSEAKIGKPIKHFLKDWENIRIKISLAEKGVPRPYQRGENHPNWQGGITPLNLQLRNSLNMKIWKKQVFERDNHQCQECRVIGGRLNAHHKKKFSILLKENNINSFEQASNCEALWRLDNGKTLCENCHKKTINYGKSKICLTN